MDFLSIHETFFNAEFKGQNSFCALGNWLLTPYRYLFGGRTVHIIQNSIVRRFHHVPSFHPLGKRKVCETDPTLHASEMSFLKTVLAIICLIPGLLLGSFFKGLGYTPYAEAIHAAILEGLRYPYTNRNTGLLLYFNNPVWCWKSQVLHIEVLGTVDKPIANAINLDVAVNTLAEKTPIDVLIIYGKNLNVKLDPGLLKLNPMKMILVNTNIGNQHSYQLDPKEKNVEVATNLDTCLKASGKWLERTTVKTIEEALMESLPRRPGFCKSYHGIYYVKTAQPPPPKIPAVPQKSKIHTLSTIN